MQIGLGGLLLIAFIILKLAGVIAWSWFWVLSPLWISVLIFLVIVVLGLLFQRKIKKQIDRFFE